MPFVKCTNFSLPSLFIKAISLPISPRVTISGDHTNFLFFCISFFHFYFISTHLIFIQAWVFFLWSMHMLHFLFFCLKISQSLVTFYEQKSQRCCLVYYAYVFARIFHTRVSQISLCTGIVNIPLQKHIQHIFFCLKMYNISRETLSNCRDRKWNKASIPCFLFLLLHGGR